MAKLVGPQKRRESHVNLPCKITKSKCVTIPVDPRRRPQPRATDGKEVLRLVSHNGVRDLVVPQESPNIYPGMLDSNEFQRLKKQATVLTLEDRMRMMDEIDAQKNKKMQECLDRKDEIKSWEKRREKGVRLNDLELDARNRADHLLKRAVELRQENEDEIKRANQLILGTKCHAIRDAQVAEKKLMQKELEEEERRLDQMMEDERRKSLANEERKQEAQRIRNSIYVKQILEQVRENDIERILGAEQVEEDARRMAQALLEIQLEECRQVKERAKDQEKVRNELKQVNDQLRYFQDMERAEERISELKIQEYMRKKAEREAAFEAEIQLVKTAKEKEIARLRALQERAQDTQAAMDELNAQRITDEVERQWRRNERDGARKKAQADAALKEARANQVVDRQRMQALEMEREKREFERILNVQRHALELENVKEARRLNNAENHREEILKQINEKEYERIKKRQETFQEGLALKLEEERRRQQLDETMQRKIGELRNSKVPDQYIKEVEKQMKSVGK